jgi:hypothetical protein
MFKNGGEKDMRSSGEQLRGERGGHELTSEPLVGIDTWKIIRCRYWRRIAVLCG